MWRRSLWLYQGWKLAGEPWYPPLTRALRRASGGLDLFSSTRVRGQADVFGETPMLTVVRLLEIAEAVGSARPSLFVDLGCGRGVTCLTAASLGVASLGFEQEQAWVGAARGVAEELGLPAHFVAGDFMQADWPADALYFVVGTAYPEAMRQAILRRWEGLNVAFAITADWSLESTVYRKLWEGSLPVEWGIARFSLWQREAVFTP